MADADQQAIDELAANPPAKPKTNGGNNEGPTTRLQRPASRRPRRTIGTTASQGDHHTIFNPERATHQGQNG